MNETNSNLIEKQLHLLLALDEARDSIDEDSDPMAMFHRIVRILKQHFDCDGTAILLVEVNNNDIEAISTLGIPQDMAIELLREAMAFHKPQSLKKNAWKHAIGLQIHIEREQHIPGSIVLVRDATSFTDDDLQLLQLAENQIDSAVIQARTLWRLSERNRELEAIYQIDRLRDDTVDEDSLFLNFANLLIKHFKADVCVFYMNNLDNPEIHIRTIIDKHNVGLGVWRSLLENTRELPTIATIESPEAIKNLSLLAAPLLIAGERLGTVLIGRKLAFNISDTRLLMAMTSQMDSALAKSRTNTQLNQRTRELEAIYRIDHIRDRINDFDEMLQLVLQELCDAVACETAYIMLYNADKEDLIDIRLTSDGSELQQPKYFEKIKEISQEALNTETVITYKEIDHVIHSMVSIPLILNNQIIGVFGAINSSHANGFTKEDARLLKAITSQVDTAVFERLERRRMRQVLGRSVDPKVLEALLKRADDSLLAGERVVLTVLFADLRGSTEWAERTEPEELVSILNIFLGKMTEVIFKHGGTLDKFVGDEVIALFGSPVPMEDHAYHAAQAALEMQAIHEQTRAELAAQGRELPAMGVGISTGEVITGEFGPPIRTDFTAMGRVMNLGARICGVALANQVVISENTQNDLQAIAIVNELTPMPLKGIHGEVKTFELLSLTQ